MDSKKSYACVTKNGDIFVNSHVYLSAPEWAYIIAHNLLHLAFGHFDRDKMPTGDVNKLVWNKACDIYVARFLTDIGFGKPVIPDPSAEYSIKLNDEIKIYEFLLKNEGDTSAQTYGMNTEETKDMIGIESPIYYKNGEKNEYVEAFMNNLRPNEPPVRRK